MTMPERWWITDRTATNLDLIVQLEVVRKGQDWQVVGHTEGDVGGSPRRGTVVTIHDTQAEAQAEMLRICGKTEPS